METEEEKVQREMVEDIASNIAGLSKSVNSLLGGRLKEKTIIVLLAQSTKMSKGQIAEVLDAIKNLSKEYLK